MLVEWESLPDYMRSEEVRPYYEILKTKRMSLLLKRLFDIFVSSVLLVLLSPLFLIISLLIAVDSRGGVFFRQERVTQYGKVFRIHKFRTMVENAESFGSQVTVQNDSRITKIGKGLRKCRLDELPQLIDVFVGNMSFVGTRPEVVKYVNEYSPEMYATLLLPAGVTSEASIEYKDEQELLDNADDVDYVYVNKILPEKMAYNLEALQNFSLRGQLKLMVKTVFAVFSRGEASEAKEKVGVGK